MQVNKVNKICIYPNMFSLKSNVYVVQCGKTIATFSINTNNLQEIDSLLSDYQPNEIIFNGPHSYLEPIVNHINTKFSNQNVKITMLD